MSNDILYRPYSGESDLANIMALVQSELSEPYVIYTFRYFLHQWFVVSFVHRCFLLTAFFGSTFFVRSLALALALDPGRIYLF